MFDRGQKGNRRNHLEEHLTDLSLVKELIGCHFKQRRNSYHH